MSKMSDKRWVTDIHDPRFGLLRPGCELTEEEREYFLDQAETTEIGSALKKGLPLP